jgi:hypothetical protein
LVINFKFATKFALALLSFAASVYSVLVSLKIRNQIFEYQEKLDNFQEYQTYIVEKWGAMSPPEIDR